EAGRVIAGFARPANPALAPHLTAIARCFAGETAEAILAALRKEGTEFAGRTLEEIGRGSPLSMKVALEAMRRARTASLEETLNMDLVIDGHMLANPDFYEGIRA